MANSYFQFKQFKVQQDNCAMKVCTDSCLFGAWLAELPEFKNALDIGGGTGLLSLMLAQQNTVHIETIEIDAAAAAQAHENIRQTPWADRITVINADVRYFSSPVQYDLIFTNPPFYELDLISKNSGEQAAKHSTHLSLDELLLFVEKQLSTDGIFAILLPYKRKTEFEQKAAGYGLFPFKRAFLQQTPTHPFFRYMALFRRNKIDSEIIEEKISIKDSNNQYAPIVQKYLKPYYLHL